MADLVDLLTYLRQVADLIDDFLRTTGASGELVGRREEQAERAVWDHACAEVVERMGSARGVDDLVRTLAREVAAGGLSASLAGAVIAQRAMRPALEDE